MLINLSEDSIITFMSMLYPVNEYDSVSAKKNTHCHGCTCKASMTSILVPECIVPVNLWFISLRSYRSDYQKNKEKDKKNKKTSKTGIDLSGVNNRKNALLFDICTTAYV